MAKSRVRASSSSVSTPRHVPENENERQIRRILKRLREDIYPWRALRDKSQQLVREAWWKLRRVERIRAWKRADIASAGEIASELGRPINEVAAVLERFSDEETVAKYQAANCLEGKKLPTPSVPLYGLSPEPPSGASGSTGQAELDSHSTETRRDDTQPATTHAGDSQCTAKDSAGPATEGTQAAEVHRGREPTKGQKRDYKLLLMVCKELDEDPKHFSIRAVHEWLVESYRLQRELFKSLAAFDKSIRRYEERVGERRNTPRRGRERSTKTIADRHHLS